MPKVSVVSAKFGDNTSVESSTINFSVDPLILDKLNIPKRAELRTDFDNEKLYRYQLEQDTAKIVTKKGTFDSRNEKFINERNQILEYKAVSAYSNLGKMGNIEEVAVAAHEASWKATTKPL